MSQGAALAQQTPRLNLFIKSKWERIHRKFDCFTISPGGVHRFFAFSGTIENEMQVLLLPSEEKVQLFHSLRL